MGNRQSNKQSDTVKAKSQEKDSSREHNADDEKQKASVSDNCAHDGASEKCADDETARVSDCSQAIATFPLNTPPVSYNLRLTCSADHTKSRNTQIAIPHTPRTVRDIKLCVEKELSIPACCQQMTFESHKLRDQDTVEQLRIREGDTLTINYTSDADVEEIREIIQAMETMSRFLQRKDIQMRLATGCKHNEDLSNDIDGEAVETLVATYCSPRKHEETRKANFLFFVSNGGLQLVHQLHQELLKYPWSNFTSELCYLEYALLRILWHTTTVFTTKTLMLWFRKSKLEAVMKSLVRVEIPANSAVQGPRHISHGNMIEALFQAIGTIGNLSELPECRLAIASRKDILDQLLAGLTCPSYNYFVLLVAAAALLYLSYSPETHPFLITDNVVEKLEKACSTRKRHFISDEQQLKYLRSLFYAQLLHASASKIPLHLKQKMHHAISRVFVTTTSRQIYYQEKKYGYFWTTITPIAKLTYFPKGNPHCSFSRPEDSDNDAVLLKELEELCTEIGVFSLQSILLSDKSREVLIAESLVDYIVCLPWHLSPETRAHGRACELRVFLGQKMQLQPPSLVNLTKAKLAVTHCGLDKVLKATSLHDIVDNVS